MLGVNRVGGICQRLEKMGREGTTEGAAELLGELDVAERDAREALNKRLIVLRVAVEG